MFVVSFCSVVFSLFVHSRRALETDSAASDSDVAAKPSEAPFQAPRSDFSFKAAWSTKNQTPDLAQASSVCAREKKQNTARAAARFFYFSPRDVRGEWKGPFIKGFRPRWVSPGLGESWASLLIIVPLNRSGFSASQS